MSTRLQFLFRFGLNIPKSQSKTNSESKAKTFYGFKYPHLLERILRA